MYIDPDQNKKPLILIVDDVPKNLQVLGNILDGIDSEISAASNGKQAFDIVQETKPDLILLDVMMPVMDGFQLCKELKKSLATKDIPIIFLTAKTEMDDIVKGFELGAVDYVTKPFNSVELLARVRNHLELKKTRDELVTANAAKDRLFSIVAHDLRNPINSLMSFSYLVTKSIDTLSKEDLVKIGNEVKLKADSTFKLLENLLDWSHSQRNGIKCQAENLELSTIVDNTFKNLKNNADDKRISLESELGSDVFAYGDKNMVSTVIRNLVSNAIKFTRQDGKIFVHSDTKNDFIEISIKDTGVGMNENQTSKLFRIETKYSTTGTANEKGSGLGLILCKEFIEKNGGRIWVESEIDKGSKFTFTLPKCKNGS